MLSTGSVQLTSKSTLKIAPPDSLIKEVKNCLLAVIAVAKVAIWKWEIFFTIYHKVYNSTANSCLLFISRNTKIRSSETGHCVL